MKTKDLSQLYLITFIVAGFASLFQIQPWIGLFLFGTLSLNIEKIYQGLIVFSNKKVSCGGKLK